MSTAACGAALRIRVMASRPMPPPVGLLGLAMRIARVEGSMAARNVVERELKIRGVVDLAYGSAGELRIELVHRVGRLQREDARRRRRGRC